MKTIKTRGATQKQLLYAVSRSKNMDISVLDDGSIVCGLDADEYGMLTYDYELNEKDLQLPEPISCYALKLFGEFICVDDRLN